MRVTPDLVDVNGSHPQVDVGGVWKNVAHPLLPVRPSRSFTDAVPTLLVWNSWTARFMYGVPAAGVPGPHLKQAVVLVAALAWVAPTPTAS